MLVSTPRTAPVPQSSLSSTSPLALFQVLTALENSVNWTESMDTLYLGYIMGNTRLKDLQNGIAHLNDTYNPTNWFNILTWSARTHKYGIDNRTMIQWALDNATVMSNGLPCCVAISGTQQYELEWRELLYGYWYAIQYNYDLSKWNITTAYTNFRDAWANTGHGFLYVYADDTVYNLGRYYDEEAETIAVFLQFYDFNVTSALADAQTEWTRVNQLVSSGGWWNPSPGFYQYRPTWDAYECEAGGFLEIAAWLEYENSSISYASNIITDLQNRFLVETWLSPQWTTTSTPGYVVIHSNPTNPEERLVNTVMAWSAMYGVFGFFNSSSQQDMTNMLAGYGSYSPAWDEYLVNSTLYYSSSNQFSATSDTGPNNLATAQTTALLFLFGIVPINATLAVPIQEIHYEYQYNMLDNDAFSIDMNARTITLGIASPGTMEFIYNTTVYHTFTSSGMYNVTFNADWSNITNVLYTGSLSTNGRYLYMALSTVKKLDARAADN